MEPRVCRNCGQPEDGVRFYQRGTVSGIAAGSMCASCWIAKSVAWRRNNRERWNKKRHRSATIKKFGISGDQYDLMFEDAKCAICGKAETLTVDHDHKTGAIRGLLCRNCNLMIGNALDSPDTLTAGAAYICRVSSAP